MTKEMTEKLEQWLSKNFCPIIETTGTIVCRLLYCKNNVKRDIAIAFTRYLHSNDPSEYIIGDFGYVLTVPSFWLSIPKELVIPYLASYIDGYLKEYVGNIPGSEGTRPPCPPPHYPPHDCPPGGKPPKPPVCPPHNKPGCKPPILDVDDCEICDNPVVNGYYITEPEPTKGTFNNVIKSQ